MKFSKFQKCSRKIRFFLSRKIFSLFFFRAFFSSRNVRFLCGFFSISIQNFPRNPKIILRTPCEYFKNTKTLKSRFCYDLPGFTRFYQILPGFTRFYQILPGFTRFLDSAKKPSQKQGCTGLPILGCVFSNRVIACLEACRTPAPAATQQVHRQKA